MAKKKKTSELSALVEHVKRKSAKGDASLYKYKDNYSDNAQRPEATERYILRAYHVTEELNRKIGMAAITQGRTKAEIVREALEQYFGIKTK